MRDTVSTHRKRQVKITPAYLTLQHCFSISEHIQRNALLGLAGDKKENRPIEVAALDVIKGFQAVMNGLNLVYDPNRTRENDRLSGDKLGLVIRLDPKGFTFAKRLAESWNSPVRVSDGSIKPYEDPKLIAAGAKLGEETFKRMYPIAEKVLSSRR